MTVTQVMGCGVQKGAPTYYRGVEVDMNLRPKVKIEIVVSLVPVQKVIDTAKAVLHMPNRSALHLNHLPLCSTGNVLYA